MFYACQERTPFYAGGLHPPPVHIPMTSALNGSPSGDAYMSAGYPPFSAILPRYSLTVLIHPGDTGCSDRQVQGNVYKPIQSRRNITPLPCVRSIARFYYNYTGRNIYTRLNGQAVFLFDA